MQLTRVLYDRFVWLTSALCGLAGRCKGFVFCMLAGYQLSMIDRSCHPARFPAGCARMLCTADLAGCQGRPMCPYTTALNFRDFCS